MCDFTNTFRVFFPSSSFRASGLIAAFAFLICLFAAQSAQAQLTLTVTRTDDRTPTATATCVPGGDCTLREAVTAANAAATNDTINFDTNVFNVQRTITLGGTALTIANNSGTLTINGTGANLLTISGNNASRVFTLNPGAIAEINNLTISNGNAGGNFGGGIEVEGGLTLNNSTVTGNSANGGGGMFILNGTATLTNLWC